MEGASIWKRVASQELLVSLLLALARLATWGTVAAVGLCPHLVLSPPCAEQPWAVAIASLDSFRECWVLLRVLCLV